MTAVYEYHRRIGIYLFDDWYTIMEIIISMPCQMDEILVYWFQYRVKDDVWLFKNYRITLNEKLWDQKKDRWICT